MCLSSVTPYDLEIEFLLWIPGVAIGFHPLGKIFDLYLSATPVSTHMYY